MIITKQQAIAEHRKMWNWIADEIEKLKRCVNIWIFKERYMSKKRYKIYPTNGCFLCEYGFEFYDNELCKHCPVKYPEEKPNECLGGIYYKVCNAKTWQEQAVLARQIAELPEREEV